MLQPRVDDLLDPIKLGSPEIAHLVETPLDVVEPRIHLSPQLAYAGIGITQARIVDEDARQNCEHIRHGGQGDWEQIGVAHLLDQLSRRQQSTSGSRS
jgi:hypothetical protein